MNITHATTELVTGDRLKAIFDRQKELMSKYHHIEARSGLMQTEDCPVNLNDKKGQARIKDFSWRVTEEVGEALDALLHEEHYQEELIDGLHFLTELTILTGRDYNTISDFEPVNEETDYMQLIYNDGEGMAIGKGLERLVTDFVKELGMMCNCLKNKPWKQSQMLTDTEAFYKRLEQVWITYLAILVTSDMSPDDIVNVYLKKSNVNKFRIRSLY